MHDVSPQARRSGHGSVIDYRMLGGRPSDDATPARLLDGAARAFVALVDETRDPVSGRLAQLFVDARVRGDRLVGRWIRRDHDGQILESGQLAADRV